MKLSRIFLSLTCQSLAALSFITAIGCSTVREQPTEEVVAVAPEEVAKPSIKREVKNLNLKKMNEDKSPKKRIVVLPFLDKSNERDEVILEKARHAFMDDLNKADEMVALDSSEIKLDLKKYIKNNEYDMPALSKDLQNAGVSALLEAKVIDLRFKDNVATLPAEEGAAAMPVKKLRLARFEVVVSARVTNVRSEQVLFHTVKTVSIEEENTQLPENVASNFFFNRNPELAGLLIKDAMLDFTPQIGEALAQITWEGRIAALNGEKIYLNVGKISGVQVGDILKVVEDGNEVYDPEIGYHIGKVPGRAKGTLEIINYFGQDGAISIIHSGAGFKENDRVELYQ
ncbi:MAG: hypothetical protein H7061_03640 [Bdellovibrionaceae bacterium]|nr:hypothetical protein [Bdellovibrio sp.]